MRVDRYSRLIYDRKTAVRPLYTIYDVLRALSLVQFLLIGRNAPIWRQRERTYMRQSGTDGLIYDHTYLRRSKIIFSVTKINNPAWHRYLTGEADPAGQIGDAVEGRLVSHRTHILRACATRDHTS